MILVTGGAGFIGSNFITDWLADSRAEGVVNVDKLTYAGSLTNLGALAQDKRHIFVKEDISNYDHILFLLRHYRIRAIVNFAAESHVDKSINNPKEFISTNVVGTYHLLEAARHYWSNLKDERYETFRFLHVSTDEVYGTLAPGDFAFSENSCYKPNSPYSASKAASDHLARAWHHTYGLPVLITNCSNNYGPHHYPEKLIPLIIVNALAGKKLPIYGDGEQIRDWLYVKDHCSAIRRVLEAGSPGEVYNVGGWNQKSNIEVVKTICSILDKLKPKNYGSYSDLIRFVDDRPGHDRRYAINASKIEHQLGWRPVETFETGIQKTVQWYLDNTSWVDSIQSDSYRK